MGHPHPAPPAGPKQAQRLRAVLGLFEGQPAAITWGGSIIRMMRSPCPRSHPLSELSEFVGGG
jgi:hypothetical protein